MQQTEVQLKGAIQLIKKSLIKAIWMKSFAILPNKPLGFPQVLFNLPHKGVLTAFWARRLLPFPTATFLQPSTSHCCAYKLPVKHLCLVASHYFKQSMTCTDITTRSRLYTLSWIFLCVELQCFLYIHFVCESCPVTMLNLFFNIAYVCEAIQLKGNNIQPEEFL